MFKGTKGKTTHKTSADKRKNVVGEVGGGRMSGICSVLLSQKAFSGRIGVFQVPKTVTIRRVIHGLNAVALRS